MTKTVDILTRGITAPVHSSKVVHATVPEGVGLGCSRGCIVLTTLVTDGTLHAVVLDGPAFDRFCALFADVLAQRDAGLQAVSGRTLQ